MSVWSVMLEHFLRRRVVAHTDAPLFGHDRTKRWTGNEGKWSLERLRQLRAERGVGRNPDNKPNDYVFLREWDSLYHSAPDNSARNLAEWERKPRRGGKMYALSASYLKAWREDSGLSRGEIHRIRQREDGKRAA